MSPKMIVATLSVCIGTAVQAVEPANFLTTPFSENCKAQFAKNADIIGVRDIAPNREDGMKLVSTRWPDGPLIREIATLAYDYPSLNPNSLLWYVTLSCHAKEIGLNILPLSSVKQEQEECQQHAFQEGIGCHQSIRNKLIGLPPDYKVVEQMPVRPAARPAFQADGNKPKPISLESLGCKFEYPQEAKAGEQEGIIHVVLTVDANGNLSDVVRISKSAGWRSLDYATVKGIPNCKIKTELIPNFSATSTTTFTASYTWIFE